MGGTDKVIFGGVGRDIGTVVTVTGASAVIWRFGGESSQVAGWSNKARNGVGTISPNINGLATSSNSGSTGSSWGEGRGTGELTSTSGSIVGSFSLKIGVDMAGEGIYSGRGSSNPDRDIISAIGKSGRFGMHHDVQISSANGDTSESNLKRAG